MNYERTFDINIANGTLRDLLVPELEKFLRAVGIIKKSDELIEFDFNPQFEGITQSTITIKVKSEGGVLVKEHV